MATQDRVRYTFSYSLLLLLCALACFIAAFCVAQGWLTKGDWQEWVTGGFIFATLAKIL